MKQHYGRKGYSKLVHMLTRKRGVEKSVRRYALTTWMAPNKYCGIFFCAMVWSNTVSLPARKMSLFSSIIITIILSYAITWIYISEIELLVEMHWTITQSVLRENQFNIFSHNITCVFKNVILRIRMFLMVRLHK